MDIIVLGFLGIVACVGIWFLNKIGSPFQPITDPNLYQATLARERDFLSTHQTDIDVLAYFPKSIPPEASATRFIRQGVPGDVGMKIEYVLPPSEITALVEKYSHIATSTDEEYQRDGSGQQPISPWFGSNDSSIPADHLTEFTVYQLGVGHGNNNNPDHSTWTYSFGVAVNVKLNEVVYWLDANAS